VPASVYIDPRSIGYCLIAAGREIGRPMPQLDLAALAFSLTASMCAFASSLQVF
jgi:hypothetical protein